MARWPCKDGLWYFQDADSFLSRRRGLIQALERERMCTLQPDNNLNNICELDRVIVSLEDCIRRRRERSRK
jgi:hypothetical protein